MTAGMDDDALLEGFERGTVPIGAWDHRAHVRVAWVLLGREPFPVALGRMRDGLQRLQRVFGIPDGVLDRGYHETLTVGWLSLVAATRRSGGAGSDSNAFCDANPHLLARTALRLFYTRERIMTETAKRAFVTPDLT
ncbi:MAG: hypothetical protein ACHQ52_15125, partial [Candidatus Eisenbacteria bacterium]